jgi:hypothetical protein
MASATLSIPPLSPSRRAVGATGVGAALKLGGMAAAREPGEASSARVRRRVGALAAGAAVLASLLVPGPASAAPGAHRAPGDGLVISVVVPIIAPWGEGGILDAETLATATSPTGVLTSELGEVLASPATVALDPMIPASIRLLGSAAPESAVDWLERLENAPNEVFLLAYADADLTALARAESLDLVEPFDLGFALDPDAFGPAETATPTPAATGTPEPDDGPPPLPTTDELLDWPDAIGKIGWPGEGSVAAGDLAAYAAAGYDATLLTAANVDDSSSALVDVDGMPALVADTAASGLLREAAAAIDATARQAAIGRLGAALDALAADPERTVVLTLDRSATFAIPGLSEVLGVLAGRTATRFTGLSGVLGGVPESATIVEPEPTPATELAPDLTDALRAEQEFATILVDPTPLVVPRQLALLDLLTVNDAGSAGWGDAAQAFLARSIEIRRSITIVDTGDVLVTSSNTSVPVRVANALDFAVTVRVDARPLRPLLRIDGPEDVTVEPGSSTTVNLGAQAITNGEVVVEVTVSSPATGVRLAPSHRVNADLQAQWETVGIIVGIIVALVFAVGIVRNVLLRRRNAGRERDEEQAGE